VGATGYIWYLNGTEIIGETSATLDATESGVYTVVAVNDEGCESGESAAVTVVVTPRATAADNDVTGNENAVCEGSAVTLTASSTSVANPVFKWYSDAALTNLVFTGATLTINPVTNTTFYVTVQGDDRCENAPGAGQVVTVTVHSSPEITLNEPASYAIEIGGAVPVPTYNVLPDVSYEWKDNSGRTVKEFGPFDVAGIYTYTLIATDDNTGCQTAVTVV